MKNHTSIKPEDILPDGVDSTIINGKTLRKGTVAAFLANVEIFENPHSSNKQKQAAIDTMKELAPAVIALGLHRHVAFKNAQIEEILIETSQTQQD